MKLPISRLPGLKPSRRLLQSLVTIAALAIFAYAASFWWVNIRNNPERIFWGAIENSLSTRSVVTSIPRNTTVNQPDQFFFVTNSPDKAATGVEKFYRSGDNDEPYQVREFIGTTTSDFVRIKDYVETRPNAEQPDISSFRNVWADITEQDGEGRLYQRFAFELIPFVYVPEDVRPMLLEKIRASEVYDVNFSNAIKTTHNGRPALLYDVRVNPEQYAAALKELAPYIGIEELKDINPSDFSNQPQIRLRVTIDTLSKQLVVLRQTMQDETSTFAGHNLRRPEIEAPENHISVEELQERLRAISE